MSGESSVAATTETTLSIPRQTPPPEVKPVMVIPVDSELAVKWNVKVFHSLPVGAVGSNVKTVLAAPALTETCFCPSNSR